MAEFNSPVILPMVLGVPLLWVVLSALIPGRAGPLLTGSGALIQLAASVTLWFQVRVHGGAYYNLGDWPMPLGIGLRVDGLALNFVLVTAVVMSACAGYAHLYLRDKPGVQRYLWPLFWFLWAGLNNIWLSADLFNLYVSLELVGLCAVGLVAITGETRTLAAALRYLIASLAGSLAYLLGVALIYGAYGSLSVPVLATQLQPGITLNVALSLMTVGLLFKSALFPLHGWLPPAHGGALTPVSALLSALVIKASFYVLARLWIDIGHHPDASLMAGLLGVLGALAIFWGSWQALNQQALKQVVAYSTVAQIGFFFMFFPLVTGVSEAAAGFAADGMVLLIASHALAKAAMFLAVGNLIISIGRDTVAGLAGISRFQPVSLFSFGLASVTVMGLPPSGGFTAKWLLLQSALASGQWHWVAVIVLGSLATAAYIFRIFRLSFVESPGEDVFNHPSRWLEAAPMTLALLSLALGLLAAQPLAMLSVRAGG